MWNKNEIYFVLLQHGQQRGHPTVRDTTRWKIIATIRVTRYCSHDGCIALQHCGQRFYWPTFRSFSHLGLGYHLSFYEFGQCLWCSGGHRCRHFHLGEVGTKRLCYGRKYLREHYHLELDYWYRIFDCHTFISRPHTFVLRSKPRHVAFCTWLHGDYLSG